MDKTVNLKEIKRGSLNKIAAVAKQNFFVTDSDDVLSFPNHVDLCDFGSGNFTMEAWIKPMKASDSMFIMGCSKNGSNPNRRGPMLFVSASTDNEIRFE